MLAVDHTCDTEYDEPCIACVRRRGMRLWQFGFLNPTFQSPQTHARTAELDGEDSDNDMRSDIEASQKADERKTRLKKLRQLNMQRHSDWINH